MNRDEAAEALLIEVSRWQRAEVERLGLFLPLWRGKAADEPLSRGTGPTEPKGGPHGPIPAV